jgi:uncharacterized membrane protein
MKGQATRLAALQSAMAELPRVRPVDMATTDRIDAECRAHLATLSPEYRARLAKDWA